MQTRTHGASVEEVEPLVFCADDEHSNICLDGVLDPCVKPLLFILIL
jgi:hypothetical protein